MLRASECKGVKAVTLLLEGSRPRGIEGRRSQDALERRPGDIVAAPQARAHAFLPEQLHRGQKQVLQQPQLVAVQRGIAWRAAGES